jgi:peptidoglycan hydrolase-like protein with peptidoglycan-binding domain
MADPDYIKWVQRSLNYDGAALPVNGVDDKLYRDNVAIYKSRYTVNDGLQLTQVGSKCQDVMIRNNWLSPAFQGWLGSLFPDAATGGSDALLKAVRKFQKDVKLEVDGYVGPKTETALIAKFNKRPEDKPIPKPQPENDPLLKWFNGLTNGERYTYIAGQCYMHYLMTPTDPELRALANFLRTSILKPVPRFFYFFTRELAMKLKNSNDPDLTKYIQKGWYSWYIQFNDSVCKVLMARYMANSEQFVRLAPYHSVATRAQLDRYVENFIWGVRELHLAIVDGIGTIAHWNEFVGEQAALKLGKNTIVGLSKSDQHLYSCYTGRMPNKWADDLTFPH